MNISVRQTSESRSRLRIAIPAWSILPRRNLRAETITSQPTEDEFKSLFQTELTRSTRSYAQYTTGEIVELQRNKALRNVLYSDEK